MRSKEIMLRTAAFVAGAGLGYVGARFVEFRGNRKYDLRKIANMKAD